MIVDPGEERTILSASRCWTKRNREQGNICIRYRDRSTALHGFVNHSLRLFLPGVQEVGSLGISRALREFFRLCYDDSDAGRVWRKPVWTVIYLVPARSTAERTREKMGSEGFWNGFVRHIMEPANMKCRFPAVSWTKHKRYCVPSCKMKAEFMCG